MRKAKWLRKAVKRKLKERDKGIGFLKMAKYLNTSSSGRERMLSSVPS